MAKRSFGAVLAVAAVVALVACGGSEDSAPPVSMPVAAEGEFGGTGFRVDGGGFLEVSEALCWTIDGIVVAWVPGSSVGDAGEAVATPDGEAVRGGSYVRFTGWEFTSDRWPGGADGRWARHAEDCGAGPYLLVLVDTIEVDPFDPQVVSTDELMETVVGARLEPVGGCGYGFAAANSDGTVGLIVSDSAKGETAVSGELPDDRFDVRVKVGSRLFEQWCTDVLFAFTDPFTAAEWPVTAGRFEFELVDDHLGRFVLEAAVVSSPGGEIELGAVNMSNGCYGCVPG